MQDIPQPSTEPYCVGDQVRIYVSPDDRDTRHHGRVCEVLDIVVDDLGTESERPLDAYSYTLRDTESGEKLPILFRHRDLVPLQT